VFSVQWEGVTDNRLLIIGRRSCLSNTGFGLNPKSVSGVVFRYRCRIRCRNRKMSSFEYDYDRDNDNDGAVLDTSDVKAVLKHLH
jgi:hypothetical protein